MSDIKRVGELEIDQDLRFQRRDWLAQRIAWAVMLAAILAALIGLFGRGPLSSVTAGEEHAALRVEYDRFVRHSSDEQMTLRLGAGIGREARIHADSALLQSIEFHRFTPEPDRQEATASGVAYTFLVDSADAPRTISVDYEPTTYWFRGGTLTLAEHEPLMLRFFVYP